MSFPRYESYRDSGVEWLREVPGHWTAKRLSHAFSLIGSGTTPPDDTGDYYDGNINWVTTGELRETAISNTLKKVSQNAIEKLSALRIYEPGTLLLAMYGATIGRLGWLEEPACTNQACCALANPVNTSPRYIFYCLTAAVKSLILLSSGGGQPNINQEKVRAFRVPAPPLLEQVAISAFLDRETAKIDALVEAQRRLIELLKEKRQAVISHAVTKGLDPTAPMKDSGIEWLGEVPAHWVVQPVKRHLSLVTSGPRGWSDLVTEEGALFFQSWNIGRSMEAVLTDANRIIPPNSADTERARLYEDDVVVCITGARTGAVAHVAELPGEAYINQHVCLMRTKTEELFAKFLAYVLTSDAGAVQLGLASCGLKQGLSLDDLRSVVLAFPELDVQKKIVHHLDASIQKINSLILRSQDALDILSERRAALISAAVTGKIDVRNAVREAEAA